MGKTYIFFEPTDRDFFGKIVVIYAKLIRGYYNDAIKAFSDNADFETFANYDRSLIFPACNYNSSLGCPRTICGKLEDRWLALTNDQYVWVEGALKTLKTRLHAESDSNDSMIDRIINFSFSLLISRRIPVESGYRNIKKFHLQKMLEKIEDDAEKLVFVCSNNNQYEFFREGMLNREKVLDACTSYQ